MGAWLQDVRFTIRAARRSPGFAALVLGILALGIGANTAIFSVARGVFLQSPPVVDPGELVAIYTTCRAGDPRCSSSYPDYLDYRDQSQLLEDLAGWTSYAYSVADEGQPPEILNTYLVTGNYFGLLGLVPARGRLLQQVDDDYRSPTGVAVISHETWISRFAGDESVIGRVIRVHGVAVEVVGVAPAGFRGTNLSGDPDLFMPLTSAQLMGSNAGGEPETFEARGSRWIGGLIGRVRSGSTADALQDEMDALAAQLNGLYPDERGVRGITVDPMSRYALPQFGREQLSRLIAILAVVVGGTLLLACANLANLLLARATTRRAEFGMRVALGASRSRILGQLLTESVVLGIIGGLLGLGVAEVILRAASAVELPGGVVLGQLDIGLDGSVFLFALLLSAATGILFGLAPAYRAFNADVHSGLRGETATGSSREKNVRRVLVAFQVGVSVVLLVGSGLFLRALGDALGTDLGFSDDGLAMVRFDLEGLGYGAADGVDLLERMRARIASGPGVSAVSYGSRVPLQVGGATATFGTIDGYTPGEDEEIRIEYIFGGPDFARTLGIELRAGQLPSGSSTDAVAMVNERMADTYWSGRAAEGGMLSLAGSENPFRIEAVLEDTKWRSVDEPPSNYVLLPYAVRPERAVEAPVTLVARGTGDPAALLASLIRESRALEPDLSFLGVRTARDLIGAALAPQRVGAWVLSAFALLALLLASVGIGGVVAYAVNRRRPEIGLRMALGATQRAVVGAVAFEMGAPILLGILGGILAAGLLSRTLTTFLLGVGPLDAPTFAVALALIAAVGAAATLVPARAASRVEPMQVLKSE